VAKFIRQRPALLYNTTTWDSMADVMVAAFHFPFSSLCCELTSANADPDSLISQAVLCKHQRATLIGLFARQYALAGFKTEQVPSHLPAVHELTQLMLDAASRMPEYSLLVRDPCSPVNGTRAAAAAVLCTC
jgi:hypothetical protein